MELAGVLLRGAPAEMQTPINPLIKIFKAPQQLQSIAESKRQVPPVKKQWLQAQSVPTQMAHKLHQKVQIPQKRQRKNKNEF